MNSETGIEIRNLSKNFAGVQALKDVSLNISRGEIFGLLGSNGAGKTTLIRLLTGSIMPSGGEISVLSLSPKFHKRELRSRIGYMPQFHSLYEDLSPNENIRFFGAAHNNGNITERIKEVIDFVGLSQRANDAIYTFSGGMKQRVSLACALVNQPEILLLDEPTSGIDPQLRAAFWSHFRQLSDSGVTVLISTHQMDEAVHCDRLAILNQGLLLAEDAPSNLLWQHKARIKIMRKGKGHENLVSNYPERLPELLQPFGLDPSIDRIEIEEEKLEEIILRLIDQSYVSRSGRN